MQCIHLTPVKLLLYKTSRFYVNYIFVLSKLKCRRQVWLATIVSLFLEMLCSIQRTIREYYCGDYHMLSFPSKTTWSKINWIIYVPLTNKQETWENNLVNCAHYLLDKETFLFIYKVKYHAIVWPIVCHNGETHPSMSKIVLYKFMEWKWRKMMHCQRFEQANEVIPFIINMLLS